LLSAEELVNDILDRRVIITSIILIIIFTLSALAGLAFADKIVSGPIGDTIKREVKGLEKYRNVGPLTPLYIYTNNLRVSLIMDVLYPTIIVPPLLIAINGIVVGLLPTGLLVEPSFKMEGLSPGDMGLLYYALLVPHGMLEITTIVLVGSLIASGYSGCIRGVLSRMVRRFILALINLSVAAIVESTVTLVVAVIILSIALAV
jgi:uncharacterized membrane protein SpoIIM required for sporulation